MCVYVYDNDMMIKINDFWDHIREKTTSRWLKRIFMDMSETVCMYVCVLQFAF